MKKQVRRTLGGLFLVSAIVVAAIPVERTQAVNPEGTKLAEAKIEHTSDKDDTAGINTNYVRAVHYVNANNDSFEKIPMTNPVDADPTWQSKVPYIKETTWQAGDPSQKDVTGDTIYVDEDMNYQFAFVKESAIATDYYAVLVGVTNSAISSNGSLTIPDTVDAYLQYTASSTRGGYCAVNRKGDFLYYNTTAQVSDLTDGLKYKSTYHTQNTVDTSVITLKAGEIAATDIMNGPETTKEDIWSNTTAGFISEYTSEMAAEAGYADPSVAIGDPAFRVSYKHFDYDSSAGYVPDGETDMVFDGTWVNKYAYFPVSPIMEITFLPCYLSAKDDWCPGGTDVDLYYWSSATNDLFNVDLKAPIITAAEATGSGGQPKKTGFVPVAGTDAMVQRLHNATVRYIGMQKVVSHTYDLNTAGGPVPITEWTVTPPTTVSSGSTLTETPSNGVFYGNANLRNLTIGSSMAGIGDYAFYKCTALNSVTFSNQLNTIGNGAFKGCNNLTTVNLDPWTNLTIIGASAFEGCTGLNSFDIPVAVTAIGDRAFKDCATSTGGIKNIYMCGENSGNPSVNMNLLTIGYNAFENDEYLDHLEFPSTLAQKIPVHYLAGCTRLNYIKSNNPAFDVIDGDQILDGNDTEAADTYTDYTWTQDDEDKYFHHDGTHGSTKIKYCDIDVWLDQLENDDFYFESMGSYALHKTAKDHSAAFNYDDAGKENWYEIVMKCDETINGGPHEATFIVDTNDNLVNVELDEKCHVITIPSSVGGHGVSTISSSSFAGNCHLYKVVIPQSVNNIEGGAFAGCHNLETVYFTEPYNYNLQIGSGAFDTQSFTGIHDNVDLTNSDKNCATTNALATEPHLSFVGAIDGTYAPFAYAMNGSNNINVGSQPTTYITYYSGFPTFLQVEYNPDRPDGQHNELVAYPTKAYLTKLKAEYDTNPEAALNTYPFMTKDDFENLSNAINGWSDLSFPSGYTQDQVICSNSIYDLDVPYGIESIKNGLFSNLDSDGKVVSDLSVAFDEGKAYEIGDYCTYGGNKYIFIKDHTAGAWEENDVAALSGVNDLGANNVLKSVQLNSIKEIEPYTFAGLSALSNVDMTGNNAIGDYAFFGCTALENVAVSGDTSSIGVRPFRDCSALKTVDFTGNNFTCEDAVIYGLNSGNKDSIVECLETRGQNFSGQFNGSTTVTIPSTVTTLQDEAFMNCDHIETVEMADSPVQIIPERAFAGTDDLYMVSLPQSLKSIKKDAFLDSNIRQVSIPNIVTQIQDANVFAQTERGFSESVASAYGKTYDEFLSGYQSDHDSSMTGKDYITDATKALEKNELNPYVDNGKVTRNVTFYTPEDSAASIYADDHPYINATATAITYKVTFKDPKIEGDDKTYWSTEVASGACSENPPKGDPKHDGTTFTGWLSSANGEIYKDVSTVPITGTTNYTAQYEGGDCTVIFYTILQGERTEVGRETVAYGTAASPPTSLPSHVDEGYEIVRDADSNIKWVRDPSSTEGFKNITNDPTTFTATYEKISSSDYHTVRFMDTDETTVYASYQVPDGGASPTPPTPTKSGYTFKNWLPQDFSNITADTDIYAVWEKDTSGKSTTGNSSTGNSSGGGSGGGSGGTQYIPYPVYVTSNSSSGNSNSGIGPIFRVTVVNGSGSGNYVAGSSVVIAANDPASGKAFDKWSTADVTLASTTLPATTFTMPNKNVTVTANYKNASATGNSNAVRYATGNSSRPPATGRTATGQTQVQVNKGGVSNVDLASATVRGSTDSFIIKVTETNEATNAVENALNNRYGSLDALKYWPCDISLYDSTGTTKITDTTGLSIEITLPIPDELRQYGGNNRVGAVANNSLEDLGTRFNTINGTPTVTFTATHFSPYVIYADTNNLVASEMLDASPKTGDPIHPKWFLAIALFAGSIFMFLKKDKKTVAVTA